MDKNARTVIIGLDGVPFGMLDNMAKTDVMPNTAKLISAGLFKKVRSTIPEVSCVAWPALISGENPGQHGIFGFTDMVNGSFKMRFPNFTDLRVPPFWERATQKCVIINVPSTYPVRPMNGVHISGFVSIDIKKSVYPEKLIPDLNDLDYRLDVDSQKAHASMDMFMEDLDKTLQARIKAYRYLWQCLDWQTFMLVFTGTDRLMHFLWDAYEDENHKYHEAFLTHFRSIDRVIGEIIEQLTEQDLLILLSDHGFEKLQKDVYVNYLLAKEGVIAFESGAEPKLANMSSATKAFALDPGRIYINQKGKYPAGNVSETDKEACLKDIEKLFSSLEIDGKKVIRHIYRKQDVYSGPYLDQAPDMILLAESGFNLKGAIGAGQLAARGLFTGKHTYPDAFLLANRADMITGLDADPSVIDVGKFIRSHVSGSDD